MEKGLSEHVVNFNDRLNRLETAVSADREVLNGIQHVSWLLKYFFFLLYNCIYKLYFE